MLRFFRLAIILSLPLTVLLLSNCKKDTSNGKLSFSNDTLTFDTVFTSLGSTTQYFRVYNNSRSDITVASIALQHLVGTQFRISVDGKQGDHFTNVVVPAKDSIYVFVEVTVNPNSAATPFVIIDDVQFVTGTNVQTVHLQAFGQNAHFHYNEIISTATTWANDLPHVIMGGELVDCKGNLTINPGCKVYFSGGAGLYVEGTLTAKATTWNDSILFRGVRLEQFYNQKPGQWFGIVFLRDTGGSCSGRGDFDYCVIDESTYGIYAGASLSAKPEKLILPLTVPNINLKHTVIKNTQNNAIYALNATVNAENSLFYAAGDNLVKLGLGGTYNFNDCTIYNTGSLYVQHQNETLLLSDFVSINNTPYQQTLTTNFTNCVVYGNLDNEISFNSYNGDTSHTMFKNSFTYCLLKSKQDTVDIFSVTEKQNLFNVDPGFQNPDGGDFTPADSAGFMSRLIDYDDGSGSPLLPLSTDLYGRPRPVSKSAHSGKYDIGAIEAQ